MLPPTSYAYGSFIIHYNISSFVVFFYIVKVYDMRIVYSKKNIPSLKSPNSRQYDSALSRVLVEYGDRNPPSGDRHDILSN